MRKSCKRILAHFGWNACQFAQRLSEYIAIFREKPSSQLRGDSRRAKIIAAIVWDVTARNPFRDEVMHYCKERGR